MEKPQASILQRAYNPRVITVAALFLLFAAAGLVMPEEQWAAIVRTVVSAVGWMNPYVLVAIYALAVICLMPLSPFALLAGLWFGFWTGSLVALAAINLGAVIAFVLGRYLIKPQVEELVSRRTGANSFMNLLQNDRIDVIALLRFNPIVPFSLHNYIYGAMSDNVNFWRYLLGTLIGSAPFTLLLVYLGYAGRALFITGTESVWLTVLLVLSALVSTVPLVMAYQKSKRRKNQLPGESAMPSDRNV